MALFKTWRYQDEQRLVIKTLWAFIAILIVMNIYMYNGWKSVPETQVNFYPPDINAGGLMAHDAIPKIAIYNFGFHIFSGINTWVNGGDADYLKLININRAYISEQFHKYLKAEFQRKSQLSELNRVRVVFDANESFDDSSVEQISKNEWRVKYRIHIQESVEGQIFKELIEVYPLVIKRRKMSVEANPFNLIIAGFYQAPYLEEKIQ